LIYCGHEQVSYWQNSGTLWSHALDCDHDDVRAHYNLANYLNQKKDLDGAITNYEEAIKLEPSLVGAHNNLGMAYSAKGDVDDAMAQYRATIKLDPDYAIAHYNLGRALLQEGETDEAIAEFKAALTVNPARAGMRNNPDLALPDVMAIGMSRYYAQFHNSLGLALEKKGQIDEAIAEYQAAVKLNPKYTEASSNLTNVSLKKGN
jgi:tetratricopeptide (TPR) repeat protein